MKLARSTRRALGAVAGLAALMGASAQAYDDKSTISSVGELLGYSSDPSADKIDYSERPKLVLPPRVGDLPSPQEKADRPGGWPADAAAVRRRNTDRYAVVPNAAAAPREQKQGLLERALSFGEKSEAPVLDEPSRRMLTEPPSGYRRPTTDLAKIRDTDGKKNSSWWNPMSYIGGGDDAAAAPQAAGAPASAQQRTASSGGGGLFSGMMPTFLRGSDN
jgi:hypothetical protein